MTRFQQKLALEPPEDRVCQSGGVMRIFRFHSPAHLRSGRDFWQPWVNDERKWDNRYRYAASGINPGSYFSLSKEAAQAEMRFYKEEDKKEDPKAEVWVHAGYRGVLDLTYGDSMEFIFSELLEFPYRRKTIWLALLASLRKQGNLLTDYVGGWAFHKGYTGIMFLSARALEPHRSDFDSSALQEGWGQYWTAMADEFDYLTLEVLLEMQIRPDLDQYANIVYFDGSNLIGEIKKFEVIYPDGKKDSGKNRFYGSSKEAIEKELALSPFPSRMEDSLKKMEALQQQVDDACAEVQSLLDRLNNRKLMNQQFGELLEDFLVSL